MTTAGTPAHPTPATLEMVAAAAGVSRATVSRVVNASPKVRPEAVEAVNRAIEALNYVPNRAARSLASKQMHAVALVVPEDMTRFFGDPYFAAVIAGITRRLDQSPYVLNLVVASSDPDNKTSRYLRSGNVDGALIVSHHSGDEFLRRVASAIPHVYGGRPSDEHEVDPFYVDVDNVAGAVIGTRHLIELGRTRIATITGPLDMPASVDRLTGFRSALTDAGLPEPLVEEADFTALGAAEATRRLLARGESFDALFVASDLMASGALPVLHEHGLSVPGDVAIVGFDDSPAATTASVPLTTVSQPSEEMGFAMADTLLRLLAGESELAHRTIMPTLLVRRASA